LTAWNDSKKIELPSWDHREQTAGLLEPANTKAAAK
jgi:hypothetical protein